MSDEQAFWNAIAADPGNRDTQAVFADWLDEQGRAQEAAVMRAGIFTNFHEMYRSLSDFTNELTLSLATAFRNVQEMLISNPEFVTILTALAEDAADE